MESFETPRQDKFSGEGAGMHGLPGDFSQPSRFVRAVIFAHTHPQSEAGDEAVEEAFHVFNQFDIPKGVAIDLHEGKRIADITQIVIAHDTKAREVYSHNYRSRRIQVVDLNKIDFNAKAPVQIPLYKEEQIDDIAPDLSEDDTAIELKPEMDGVTVSLKVGQVLRISLDGNRTTGFAWAPRTSNSALYEWIKERDKPTDTPAGVVGGAGTQQFELKALQPGNINLEFDYRRPWKKRKPAKTACIALEIQN